MDWFDRKQDSPVRRFGETVAFDVTQNGNEVAICGDGIEVCFAVDGIDLPSEVDPSFAVWGILPRAMEEGFNLHINKPIDPQVSANAQRLSEIWEMWVPNLYRSIKVSGEAGWQPRRGRRLPLLQLFSGGIDSTYSVLAHSGDGFVATVCGVDRTNASNIRQLCAKTDPLLRQLNCRRIVVRTNAQREPSHISHGFTLAGSLFLLSDLFQVGTIAADSTPAEDMATFPWGSNYVTNQYLVGSDFSLRTVGVDIKRTEKISAIVGAGLELSALSFCRNPKVTPENCGRCRKCIRTKAMFLLAAGEIPKIFVDDAFDRDLIKLLGKEFSERVHLFDIYSCAKKRGMLNQIPGLETLVEQCRAQGALT